MHDTEAATYLLMVEDLVQELRHKLNVKTELSGAVSQLGRDIKLQADFWIEQQIKERLSSVTPFAIIAEESQNQPLSESELTWIIDPLDGSYNFHRNLPCCGISIALWKGFKPILGLFCDLTHGEIYKSARQGACFLNDQPITVSQTSNIRDAVLCTGFPAQADLDDKALKTFIQQVQQFKKIRMIGSAATSLALVAAGRADAYFEKNIKLWDIAAGAALITHAGGRFHFEQSIDPFTFNVYASNAALSAASPVSGSML